jgi:hypothetical protein
VEEFNPEREFYIASLNELRDALDHIFRAFDPTINPEENAEENIKKAQDHLERAGIDAGLLFAASTYKGILRKIEKKFSNSAIRAALPEYYSKMLPAIEEIQMKLADARVNNRGFTEIWQQTTALTLICNECQKAIPSLKKYDRKYKYGKLWWMILAAICGSAATIMVKIFL